MKRFLLRWMLVFTLLTLGVIAAGIYLGEKHSHPQGEIAFMSNYDGNFEIYLLDLTSGLVHNLTHNPADDIEPAWSPDGQRLAFVSNRDGYWGVFVLDMSTGSVRRLTQGGDLRYSSPVWSPDGTQIAYAASQDDDEEIFVLDVASTAVQQLTHNDVNDLSPTWSPDGARIAFISQPNRRGEIHVMATDGSKRLILTDDRNEDFSPDWSPDSAWLAFSTIRDGNFEIYVMNVVDDPHNERRLTTDEATDGDVDWLLDGRLLFISNRAGYYQLYIMNPDGTQVEQLTDSPFNKYNPNWRPGN